MRVVMECPRCGRQNARVLQHCWACGEWLHGTSPVVSVCRDCQLPVRDSELVCSNCGLYLEPRLKQEGSPRLPEEKRLGWRVHKAVARPARASARLLSAAFLCRGAGIALLVAAVARGAVVAQEWLAATAPDEAMFAAYAAVLWGAVGAAGLTLLLVGVLVLRRE